MFKVTFVQSIIFSGLFSKEILFDWGQRPSEKQRLLSSTGVGGDGKQGSVGYEMFIGNLPIDVEEVQITLGQDRMVCKRG